MHGFTQEQMPKIERSVAYTFDAYSGGLESEPIGELGKENRFQFFQNLKISINFNCLKNYFNTSRWCDEKTTQKSRRPKQPTTS